MKQTLTVPGINCGHCKMAIEGAVKKLPGISSVLADPASKTVSLDFDESAVSPEAVKKAIEGAGYTVAP